MSSSAAQQTYDQILEKLISGVITPGARLVNRTLAAELGVSVIPVREALNRLASEGLVKHIPGAGTYARHLDGREILKLYSFREHLEVYAVREAARHIHDFQRDRLQAVCEESQILLNEIATQKNGEATPGQVRAWLERDRSFHGIIIEAADNSWLARAASQLRLFSYVLLSKPAYVQAASASKTLEEHNAIATAIINGQGDEAARIMGLHIRSSVNELLKNLSPEL